MAKGTVNKVILIGRLGSDPELRYTPSNTAVANFNVATNEAWKDRDGNAQERTEWHRIVLWNKQAELANEYLKKGSRVYIEGRLETRQWEDKEGNKRWTTEVRGMSIEFLDSRETGAGGPAPQKPMEHDMGGAVGGDDDLPF